VVIYANLCFEWGKALKKVKKIKPEKAFLPEKRGNFGQICVLNGKTLKKGLKKTKNVKAKKAGLNNLICLYSCLTTVSFGCIGNHNIRLCS
jgi:hypothetical protein